MTEKSESERTLNYTEISKMARAFMRNWDTAVLSTYQLYDKDSYPFGSITPFVLSDEGDVIILISDLANHTKNILKNNKVGLTVFDLKSKSKQASARVSLIGSAELLSEGHEKLSQIKEKYFTFFPNARNYLKAHNFYFTLIKPKHIHYIKTFGEIYKFDVKNYWKCTPHSWPDQGKRAIDHMNESHKENLFKYAQDFLNIEATEVELLSVDSEGFHMIVDKNIHYINFLQNAYSSNELRNAFIDLTKV